jgi:hypothetical protein
MKYNSEEVVERGIYTTIIHHKDHSIYPVYKCLKSTPSFLAFALLSIPTPAEWYDNIDSTHP